jgi:hypothetical protein
VSAPAYPIDDARRHRVCRFCGATYRGYVGGILLADRFCPTCLALMAAAAESVARFDAETGPVERGRGWAVIVSNLPKRSLR